MVLSSTVYRDLTLTIQQFHMILLVHGRVVNVRLLHVVPEPERVRVVVKIVVGTDRVADDAGHTGPPEVIEDGVVFAASPTGS